MLLSWLLNFGVIRAKRNFLSVFNRGKSFNWMNYIDEGFVWVKTVQIIALLTICSLKTYIYIISCGIAKRIESV